MDLVSKVEITVLLSDFVGDNEKMYGTSVILSREKKSKIQVKHNNVLIQVFTFNGKAFLSLS